MKACPTCHRALTFGKSHEQRKKFHALCTEIGLEIGLTPGQVKAAVKQEFYGFDEFKMGKKWYRIVQSSEDSDRAEYSRLIDFALQWAAENGVVIDDLAYRQTDHAKAAAH
jgi:hypothetical protein